MFIKDNKRFNPFADITFKGVTYSGNLLSFPSAMLEMGVTEVPDPPVPEGYSPDTYFRLVVDEAPYVVYEPKSPEQVRQAELARIPEITPWQMRKALNQLGLREQVETAVAAGNQDVKDAWEFATSFVRTDPLVVAMQSVLGKTDAEVDALFMLGASL